MKPKPGGSYEMGSDGAAGRLWGTVEAGGWPSADGWPWRVRGHAVESQQVTTSPELRWKAHIYFGEN